MGEDEFDPSGMKHLDETPGTGRRHGHRRDAQGLGRYERIRTRGEFGGEHGDGRVALLVFQQILHRRGRLLQAGDQRAEVGGHGRILSAHKLLKALQEPPVADTHAVGGFRRRAGSLRDSDWSASSSP